MPITSTNTYSLTTVQNVIIDCTRIVQEDAANNELLSLMGWVSAYPQRSMVHVILKSATGNGIGRKLRGAFQALGCTVSIQTRF